MVNERIDSKPHEGVWSMKGSMAGRMVCANERLCIEAKDIEDTIVTMCNV